MVNDLRQLGVDAPFYDLREHPLPFCDAVSAHRRPEAGVIIEAIRSAQTVLLALPIYNYDVNAAAKNLLELGLRAWNHKLVGFLCVAGGRNSYMSVMGMANNLMLDFRCIIIPRFVYATGGDFAEDRQPTMHIATPEIKERIAQLATVTVDMTRALANVKFV